MTVAQLVQLARPPSARARAVIGLLGGWLVIAGYGFAAGNDHG